MKLHTEREDIERGGVQAEAEFKIKTTAKAFDILSSGLYTDPITAIIRELSCNAYDSHVEAGNKDIPFEVHLPNRLEPWFSVKDYGVGLDHDEVMNLYTTYFDSTKTGSNDYIGALGLGSKSPFAYTSAFEVVAQHNGKRRIYSAFINEDGVPTIAKLGEVDTDESNGVEVKLTVQTADHYKFKDKAQKALKWFEVKPSVVGDPYFKFQEVPKAHTKGDGWIIHKKDWGDNFFTVVQGNVAYKCDFNQLDTLTENEKSILRRNSITAFFTIGDLEVAASREEIRYDKRTKQALVTRFREILAKARKQIEKEAEKYKECMWDATIALTKLAENMFGNSHALVEFMAKSSHPVVRRYVNNNGVLQLEDHVAHEVSVFTYHSWGARKMSQHRAETKVSPSNEMAVFYNDLRIGGIARIKEFLAQSKKFERAVAFRPIKDPTRMVQDEDGKWGTVPITEIEVEDEYAQIIKDLGNPKVLAVSTDTPVPKRAAFGRGVPIYRFDEIYRSSGRTWGGEDKVRWTRLTPDSIDLNKGGLYFYMKFGSRIVYRKEDDTEHEVNWPATIVQRNLFAMVDIANRYGDFDDDFNIEDLIGLGSQARSKIEKLDNWGNVFDLVLKAVPEYKNQVEYLSRLYLTPPLFNLKDAVKFNDFAAHVRKLTPTSGFRKAVLPMIEDFEKYEKGNANGKRLQEAEFIKDFDQDYGARTFVNIGQPYYDETPFTTYPMVKEFVGDVRVGTTYNPTNLDILFDYIDTIDRSK